MIKAGFPLNWKVRWNFVDGQGKVTYCPNCETDVVLCILNECV